VAGLLGCEPGELVFTSGATEAINLGIKGAAAAYQSKGRHFITCTTEHRAVLDVFEHLERDGAEVTRLPVQPDGRLDPELLRSVLRNDTVLVAIMLANNESGVLQPIRELAELTHERGALFFCDTTQAIGKLQVAVNELGIDLCTVSAHKSYGPKGIGALFVRRKNPRVTLVPQLDGGGHEHGLRSGTLNVPGIVGLGAAAELVVRELWDDNQRISLLRSRLEQELITRCGAKVNGNTRHRLPNTTNLCFPALRASELISACPQLAISTGSACSSALPEPSHVLRAMGLSEADAYASIRISLGRMTTEEEVRRAVGMIASSCQ
ncbi:MAG TPA: cysteine desulfurase family protein, partial [Bacteroidia bacterium]|nr:cysteine desulfurase family protein [Bacteroidia bacterium]